MPSPLPIDWASLRDLFVRGMSLKEIAKTHNISYGALRTHAARNNWSQAMSHVTETVTQAVTSAVTENIAEKAAKWSSDISSIVDSHVQHLKTVKPGDLKLRDFKTLAEITALTNQTGRTALGLDKTDVTKTAIGIRVSIDDRRDSLADRRGERIKDVQVIDIGSDGPSGSSGEGENAQKGV